MTEYIEKNRAVDALRYIDDELGILRDAELYVHFEEELKDTPAADVTKIVNSEWQNRNDTIECPECGFGMFPSGYFFINSKCISANDASYRPNYCPNCGARMDGGKNHE